MENPSNTQDVKKWAYTPSEYGGVTHTTQTRIQEDNSHTVRSRDALSSNIYNEAESNKLFENRATSNFVFADVERTPIQDHSTIRRRIQSAKNPRFV